MDRINSASKEVDKFGSGKHGFTDGDPADPSSGTLVNEDFMDGVQEELLYIIEQAGLTPTDADYTQVLEGLEALLIAKSTPHKITFTGRDSDRNPCFERLDDSTITDNDRTLIWYCERGTNFIHVYATNEGIEVTRDAFWTSGGWTNVGSSPGLVRIDALANATVALEQEWSLSAGAFTESRRLGAPQVQARVDLSAGSKTVTGRGFTATDVTLNTTDLTINFTTAFPDANYNVSLTGEYASAHYFYDFDRVDADTITVYALNSSFAAQTMSSFVGSFHIVAMAGG